MSMDNLDTHPTRLPGPSRAPSGSRSIKCLQSVRLTTQESRNVEEVFRRQAFLTQIAPLRQRLTALHHTAIHRRGVEQLLVELAIGTAQGRLRTLHHGVDRKSVVE